MHTTEETVRRLASGRLRITGQSAGRAGGAMKAGNVPRRVLQGPVRVYRKFISPLKPPTCRFYPTCSAYALEALEKHGAVKGSWLAIKRISRCHPFHPGGYDPVPPAREGGSGAEEEAP